MNKPTVGSDQVTLRDQYSALLLLKIWKRNSPGPQNALDAYLHVKNLTTQGIDVEMVRINPERVVNGTL